MRIRGFFSGRAALLEATDTIYALASAPGRAGVSVVRVAGPAVPKIVHSLLPAKTAERLLSQPQRLLRSQIVDAETDQLLDDAMAVYFKAPHSFTGEETLELHLHGSEAVLSGLYQSLGRMAQVRQAGPGEFTQRAWSAGKLDLTALEGLADLLEARTPRQRHLALRQLGGAIQQVQQGWRDELVRCLASLDAWLDFGEEEDPMAFRDDNDGGGGFLSEVIKSIEVLSGEIQQRLKDDRGAGELVRRGLRVALVGKSSLLNRLVERPAALVSPLPGTTRDVIEAEVVIDGIPVVLQDTAGIRHLQPDDHSVSHDTVEAAGMQLALERAASADLVLLMIDQEPEIDQRLAEALVPERTIVVFNKSDLRTEMAALPRHFSNLPSWHISCTQDPRSRLLDLLREALQSRRKTGEGKPETDPILVRERHLTLASRTLQHLNHALHTLQTSRDVVLAAEAVRSAILEIGRMTCHVDPEEVLDALFSTFCIGK